MMLHVVVVHSPGPRTVREIELTLDDGSLVGDAVAAAGLAICANALTARPGTEGIKAKSEGTVPVGVWGRLATLNQPLRDLDRVEFYRPLKVDPKVARRARFASQGVKKAGLFADRRSIAKPGR